jgi:two-component system C4-dicarboxylate transport sensor histidine kinase DctB
MREVRAEPAADDEAPVSAEPGNLVLAHQLRQPLAAVKGWIELVDAHAAEPARVRELAARAHEALSQATAVLDGVLDAMRVRPVPRRVELRALVRGVVRALGERARAVDALELDEGSAPLGVSVVPALVEVVLTNLLGNALDAALGSAERRVLVRLAPTEGGAEVMVADTGAGIPDALRERVFDAGFTTKERGAGVGLGLAIARSFAARAGGELALHASPPAPYRTAFVVRLPRA